MIVGSDVKPDTAPQTLQVTAAGIQWIELFSSQGSVAYDDLSFSAGPPPRTVIGFEGLPAMTGPSGTPVPPAAALGDQLAASHGVVFSTVDGSEYVAVAALGLDHAASGTNAIGGVAGGTLAYPRSIRIRFVNPADPRFRAVTDSVGIRMDQYVDAGTVTMIAYGASGELLGTNTVDDTLGQMLHVDAVGIHSVVLSSTGGSVAFDDLSFTALREVLSTVVEVSAVRISWPSKIGVNYQAQSALEPVQGEWANVGPKTAGTGEVLSVVDEVVTGSPKKFYRVSVVP